MASTYSALKIELIGTGDQTGTWGNTTNVNLGDSALGEAITGSADVAFSSADVTITLVDTNATQSARNLRLNLTGTSGGARNLILGSGCQIEKLYLVNNGLADAVTVKNTTGTGIAVAAGKTMFVYNNGTNVVDAITHLTSLTTGVLSASGATTFTAGTASTSTTTGTAVITGGLGVSGRVNAANFDGIVGANTAAAGSFTTINASTSITNAGLTSGRVTFAGASGLLSDSSTFVFDGTNVGIGTSSPACILDVTKSTNSGSTFPRLQVLNSLATQGDGSTTFNFARFDAKSGNGAVIADFGTRFDSYAGGFLGTETNHPIFFQTNGTERMRIDSSGFVGIGTSSPSSYASGARTLVLASSGDNGMTIRSGTTSTGALYFANAENSTSNNGMIEVDHNASAMSFNIYGTGRSFRFKSAGTEVVRIDSSGNLGIGTTTPTALLDITSSTIGYMNLTGGASNAQGAFIRFRKSATDIGYLGTSSAILGDSSSDFIMYADGARNATIWTNGVERMRIDTSGNLLVGTTSVNNAGVISVDFNGQSKQGITLDDTYASVGGAYMIFRNSAGGNAGIISHTEITGIGLISGASLILASADTERMRLDSSGNVLVGKTTSAFGTVGLYFNSTGQGLFTHSAVDSGGAVLYLNRLNVNGAVALFYKDTTEVGNISVTGSATAYNTSSDYRLKENIVPMTGALAKVVQLKPVTYKWKVDGSDGQGFIAHELAEVVPDCVTGEKDAVDKDGKPAYQGVDTSFLVATLTAAIQEQQALIESLTTRLTALENK